MSELELISLSMGGLCSACEGLDHMSTPGTKGWSNFHLKLTGDYYLSIRRK